MGRALSLLICAYLCGLMGSTEARWGQRMRKSTPAGISSVSPISTSATNTRKPIEEVADAAATQKPVDEKSELKDCPSHPAAVKEPRLMEHYDHRSPDGLYEYRYVLSNGDTRYERAYWNPVGPRKRILARRGFYSYPLPNENFLTVYYTADQDGYRQDSATYTQNQPMLPRSLVVPDMTEPSVSEAQPSEASQPHVQYSGDGWSEESEAGIAGDDSAEVAAVAAENANNEVVAVLQSAARAGAAPSKAQSTQPAKMSVAGQTEKAGLAAAKPTTVKVRHHQARQKHPHNRKKPQHLTLAALEARSNGEPTKASHTLLASPR